MAIFVAFYSLSSNREKKKEGKKKKRIHPVEFPIRETENFNDPYALFIFLPDGIQGNSLAPINSLLYGILMKKKRGNASDAFANTIPFCC